MTPTDASPTPPAAGPPEADLTCPLCEYNLRGLTEPRCPECGFAFQWAELLDAKRDRHPWLFEHGRGHSVRAFFTTYTRTCLPRRFWRRVTPANPVHAGRLVTYWLLAAVPLLAMAVPFGTVYALAARNLEVRSYYSALASGRRPPPVRPGSWSYRLPIYRPTRPLRSPADLDVSYPPPWSPAFLVEAWDLVTGPDVRTNRAGTGESTAVAVAFAAGWPWLSVAALLIFQASMRRAKVNPAHVLRVAVYGCDFGLLVVAVVAGWGVLLVQSTAAGDWVDRNFPPYIFRPGLPTVAVTVVACAAVATYRLTVAYARYMRFDRPLLTVLASQVIAVLAALTLLAKVGVLRQ